MTNQFPGLARGPIDHEASSVINSISGSTGAIIMGSALVLDTTTIPTTELLARVNPSGATLNLQIYGIAVGGDNDGIYGDGTTGTNLNKATLGEGESVVVVTQGRCLVRVKGANAAGNQAISVGDPLVSSDDDAGTLFRGTDASSEFVVARALQAVDSAALDVIAIDFQREGKGVTI